MVSPLARHSRFAYNDDSFSMGFQRGRGETRGWWRWRWPRRHEVSRPCPAPVFTLRSRPPSKASPPDFQVSGPTTQVCRTGRYPPHRDSLTLAFSRSRLAFRAVSQVPEWTHVAVSRLILDLLLLVLFHLATGSHPGWSVGGGERWQLSKSRGHGHGRLILRDSNS